MKQVSATIISNTELMPGNYLINISAPDISCEAKPGQFIMVNCGPEFILRRPLSIHQVVNSDQLSILFCVVGKGTSWLSRAQKGDNLDLLGPLGNGFTIEPATRNMLLVAGGIGIAPLMFLAYYGLAKGKSVTLLLGSPTVAQLYPPDILPGGLRTVLATEDGSIGTKGMITDVLPDFIDWADQVFACGPLPMYLSMFNLIRARRFKKNVQVSLEIRMGCGIGACYGCGVKTKVGMKRICRDGPVFDLKDILWQKIKI